MNRFCTECGTKAEAEFAFCQECGKALPELKKQRASGGIPTMPSISQLSKKTKIIIASIAFVIISILGLYQLGESVTDKDKLLTKFSEAIDKEDVNALKKLLVSGKENSSLESENIEVMLNFWNEHNYVKSHMLSSLKEQSVAYGRKGNALEVVSLATTEEKQAFVHLRKNGKKFLVFDRYDLVVYPVALLVETNDPQATYTVNGEEVIVREWDWNIVHLGNYLPGKYQVNASLRNDFVEVSHDLQVTLRDSYDYQSVYFDVEEVYVESSFDNMKVYINGKDSQRILFAHGDYFGPVLTDGSMTLHFEIDSPSGVIKSAEYNVDGSAIYPYFPVDHTLKDELMKQVNDYLLSYFKVLMTKDLNHLQNATNNIRQDIESNLASIYEHSHYFIGYIHEVVYDVDFFEYTMIDGEWGVNVAFQFDFDYTHFDEELRNDSYYGSEPTLATLVYTNSQWLVNDLHYHHSFDPIQTKVHTFDQKEQEKYKPDIKVVLNPDRLISDYLYNMVYAINYRAFYEVEPYLLPDSELYKSQKALVENYYERGIEQTVIDFEILSVEEVNANRSKIKVAETIGIYSNGEYREELFHWWYTAEVRDHTYYLSKLEKAY